MNHFKFRQLLDRIGFTQVGAARKFDVNERTLRRWASGEQPIPHLVSIVLWLMDKFKVKPEDLPEPVDEEAEFYRSTSKPVAFSRPAKPEPQG